MSVYLLREDATALTGGCSSMALLKNHHSEETMIIEQVFFNIFLQFMIFVIAVLLFGIVTQYLVVKGAHTPKLFLFLAIPFCCIFNIITTPVSWLICILTGTKASITKTESLLYPLSLAYDDDAKRGWWNPIKQFGNYASRTIDPILVTVVLFFFTSLLLPATFASVMEGLGSWADMLGKPFDLEHVGMAYDLVIDIVWTRLIIGGANENLALFILYVICFVTMFSTSFAPAVWYTEDGEHISLWNNVAHLPGMLLIVTAYNFIFAMVDWNAYADFSLTTNSVAMQLLLVWVVLLVARILILCFDKIIGSVIKKK